jgi:Toprim domain
MVRRPVRSASFSIFWQPMEAGVVARKHIDMAALRAALAQRAADVAIALVGQPNRPPSSERELRFGNRGSLAVLIQGPIAGLWHDHENGVGGDLLNLIRRVRGGSFHDAIAYGQEIIGSAPQRPASPQVSLVAPQREDEYRSHLALALWNEAVPIVDTIAAVYLTKRAIRSLKDIDGPVLRFHPTCPFGERTRHSCLLALLRDIHSNEPRAIQRTALTTSGEKIGRLTLGPKIGTAVKLSSDETVTQGLAVGEGLETVLSAMELGFNPAWALGDANSVRAFPILSGIECLTIIVDNDESGTGQQAALECSRRWTTAGREVFRIIPDRCGDDLNDIVARTVA